MLLITKVKSAAAALLVTGWLLAGPPAFAAGTTPLALQTQFDLNGNLAAGCRLFFYQAGTPNAPQNAFPDTTLTGPALPNPLPCDAFGRVPMHWLADGLIHLSLLDSTGATILDTTMQVLGSSSGGGGGGGTVDPTSVASTGDLKVKYATGAVAGWVRTNGLTIGNATSGASERANSDTQALFIFLYNCGDATLVVSGGRSGNAISDYNAGKTITTPDYAGQALAALDDQGAGAKGRLTPTYFANSTTLLGSFGGFQNQTLLVANIPSISSSGSNAINVANASQAISVANASQAISVANASQAISVANASQNITASGVNNITASGNNAISVTSSTSRFVSNTGIIDSATTGGGTQGIFHDVNAVSMGGITSTNPTQAISVANASQNISVSGTNAITASGTNAITASGTNAITASGTNAITASGTNTINVTSTGTTGSAFATLPPMKLATIYIKL